MQFSCGSIDGPKSGGLILAISVRTPATVRGVCPHLLGNRECPHYEAQGFHHFFLTFLTSASPS